MAIKDKFLVEKRNDLNEIRSNNMTLPELRFFSIYLAKINARDISTRIVRFSVSDFQKIMELGRLNITHLRNAIDTLLSKVVGVNLEHGGFRRFQLFKIAEFTQGKKGEWYIEIDAHDEALPLMFEFKERYFTYELWNALRLKSINQLRMYELLKQYEKIGERTLDIDDLKELLGLSTSEYPRYGNFKSGVLDSCQKALETYTDIKFKYEPIRRGKGGKVTAIKFRILHNDNYKDPISLADFMDIETETLEVEFKDKRLEFLAEACDNEFKELEMQVLYNVLVQLIPDESGVTPQEYQIKAYDSLKMKYDYLNLCAERAEIKNRFAYLKKLLEIDVAMQTELL